jgi:hypothetical protein
LEVSIDNAEIGGWTTKLGYIIVEAKEKERRRKGGDGKLKKALYSLRVNKHGCAYC